MFRYCSSMVDVDPGAGKGGHRLARQPLHKRLLHGQAAGLEVADDELDDSAIDARLLDVWMHETLMAVRRFRRQALVRQPVDEVGCDLDRVDHLVPSHSQGAC